MKSENLDGRNVLLSNFVEQDFKTIQKNDPKEMALLSPAEKSLLSLEDKLEILDNADETYKTVNQSYVTEAKSSAPDFKPLLRDGSQTNLNSKNIFP